MVDTYIYNVLSMEKTGYKIIVWQFLLQDLTLSLNINEIEQIFLLQLRLKLTPAVELHKVWNVS